MLDVLKNIPLIDNLRSGNQHGGWLMTVDDHPAKGETGPLSLSIALFINHFEEFTPVMLHYLTLLLAAHPDMHDYALQLTGEGGWLYGYYEKNISIERMSVEIEKHLSLTRYLKNIIFNQSKPYSGERYDVSE